MGRGKRRKPTYREGAEGESDTSYDLRAGSVRNKNAIDVASGMLPHPPNSTYYLALMLVANGIFRRQELYQMDPPGEGPPPPPPTMSAGRYFSGGTDSGIRAPESRRRLSSIHLSGQIAAIVSTRDRTF